MSPRMRTSEEHLALASEVVGSDPERARRAVQTGNYMPLISAAQERARAEGGYSAFMLAQLVGRLARGEVR